MRISNVLNESFTNYKIEKWNEKKECWEYYRGYYSFNSAIYNYTYLLKNNKGIYRLINVIELDER